MMLVVNAMIKMRLNQVNKGFSLIEVLFALFISTLGIVSSSTMLIHSMKSNQSLSFQYYALMLATNMKERLKINHVESNSYLIDFKQDRPNQCTEQNYDNSCEVGQCTPKELVRYDLTQWKYNLVCMLPQGDGKITIQEESGNFLFNITVQYLDKNATSKIKQMVVQGIL